MTAPEPAPVGDVEALAEITVAFVGQCVGQADPHAKVAELLAADRARVRAEERRRVLAEVERMHAVIRFEDFDIERLRGMAEAGEPE